jgi:ribosomal protein S18 acetylase RimI-like enzyme
MISIRKINVKDHPDIWGILNPIFRAGDTYAVDPDISEENALDYWAGGSHTAYVAEYNTKILGTYYICPNQAGNGSHICNCGFTTHPDARGKGIARTMLENSLGLAKTMGYLAMQFNFVLTSNGRAVATWEKYGFKIIGRIPEAFNHPTHGYVDALVMHKRL